MPARRSIVVALFAAAASVGLPAQAAGPVDHSGLIGMDPPALVAALGAPQQIVTQRGEAPDQDNVVFFYPDCRSVFWYQNRVWQVRFDRRYAGSVMGFRIGMRRSEAEEVASGRLQRFGDSLYLTVETLRFPLRLRLALEDDRVVDMYLYRSDY